MQSLGETFHSLDYELFLWILVAIICIYLLELWRRNRNLPPGPWGLPLLGYYPFLGPQSHIKLNALSFKYGDVLSFRTLGGHLVIMLHRLPIVKEILVSRGEEFIGKPEVMNVVHWYDDGLGIAQSEGSAWKEQRRFFLQSAKSFGFGKMESEPLIHEMVQMMLDDIRKLNGKCFEPSIHISHVTANVISACLFNKRFSKDDETFLKFAKGYKELVGYFEDNRILIVGPIFEYVLMKLLPSGRRAERTKSTLMSMVKEIMQEHLDTFDEKNLRDFTDSYIDHMNKLQKEGNFKNSSFTMDRFAGVLFNMFLEGTESVGTAVVGLLSELCNHKLAQKRAQEELDAVVGRNRLPSWADRQNLPYVEALILELYRLSQPFFISSFYANYEETTIRNYRIPKRSIILVNLWSINNDPTQFKDPSKFDPERFLNSDKKRAKQEGPAPFGIGKRACPGEALAQMVVFILIASLLQNFTLYKDESKTACLKMVLREKI